MRLENSSLLKRLTDISQKYNEAAVDNRVLKADVETLRAKVGVYQNFCKLVTGHPLKLAAVTLVHKKSTPLRFCCSLEVEDGNLKNNGHACHKLTSYDDLIIFSGEDG